MTGPSCSSTCGTCLKLVRRPSLPSSSFSLIAVPLADASRVGVFGTSFGGGHVIAVAAKDKRVAAAISQCPFTSGPHSAATLGWYAPFALTALGIKDLLFGKPGDYVPVKLAGKPGEGVLCPSLRYQRLPLTSHEPTVALMNAPDVESGYKRLIPPSLEARGLPITVAARAALQIPFLRPGSYAPQVECPIFFAICKGDTVAPAGPTRGWAKMAPRGVVKEYEVRPLVVRSEAWKSGADEEVNSWDTSRSMSTRDSSRRRRIMSISFARSFP